MFFTRKITSPKKMWELWEEYKRACDNHKIPKERTVHRTLTNDEGTFETTETVTEMVLAPISYTMNGFCVFVGLSHTAMDKNYRDDPRFKPVLDQIREETEADVRSKFESGQINSRLAPLWMSHFGYSTKTEARQEVTAENNLLDVLKGTTVDTSSIPEIVDDEDPDPGGDDS